LNNKEPSPAIKGDYVTISGVQQPMGHTYQDSVGQQSMGHTYQDYGSGDVGASSNKRDEKLAKFLESLNLSKYLKEFEDEEVDWKILSTSQDPAKLLSIHFYLIRLLILYYYFYRYVHNMKATLELKQDQELRY
jgi:hypothetical protein